MSSQKNVLAETSLFRDDVVSTRYAKNYFWEVSLAADLFRALVFAAEALSGCPKPGIVPEARGSKHV